MANRKKKTVEKYPGYGELIETLRLCMINADCAAEYAGTKGISCAPIL